MTNEDDNQNVDTSDIQDNSWKDSMLGERNSPYGHLKMKYYRRYYDVSHTITNATATNPNDQDSPAYDDERVHDALQRTAPFLRVVNDGIDGLYVLVSHGGEQTFSPENVIYPGDVKDYLNVYTLRLRSPTAGLPYRVSEYKIMRVCCPSETLNIQPTWFHAAEETAPLAGAALITKTVGPGKNGYFYGFLISSDEPNDFEINWTSGGNSYSILVVFGSKGTTQDTETTALNIGLPADAGTDITINNVNAGGAGTKYQARLLYLES